MPPLLPPVFEVPLPARFPATNLFIEPYDSLRVMLLHPCDRHPVLMLQNPPVVNGIVVLAFKLSDFVPDVDSSSRPVATTERANRFRPLPPDKRK